MKVDLGALSQKFCPGSKEFLLRANEPLNMIFTQLYRTPKSIRQDYFKLKITELLLQLSALDPSEYAEERQYFPAQQTEKIKEIHALLTGDLGRNYTIDELSQRFEIPSASLRKIFKAVYGNPIYQYIRNYRMNAAASMLVSEPDINIAEIAQKLGYDNASKFSAAFRDVMGVSPQEYRKGER